MTDEPTDRRQAPPTVVQRTRAAPTVVQSATGRGVPTATQRDGPVGNTHAAPAFPDALLIRFEPVRVLGAGSEATVWEVRRRDSGEPRAVKVHKPDQPMEIRHLERLDNPRFRRHVPQIFGYDEVHTPYGTNGWVELELLPTTLADLMEEQSGRGGMPVVKAKELVAELAEALRFWQEEIELNPIDFKPDNFLVRPGRRVQLVLADFGGLSAFTASQEVGKAKAAMAYMPPEELWNQKNRPWPWWSLGRIVVEMVTGYTRYRDSHGRLRGDLSLIRDRVLGTPDLASLPDDRWRRLVSGLLTKKPEDRWGHRQVEEWLAGGDPPVARQDLSHAQAGPKHDPITFDGTPYHDQAALAVAMLQRWQQAADWLAGTGPQQLLDWFDLIGERRFDRQLYLRGLKDHPELAHLTVTAFGATMAPHVRPRYRGEPVDADGLTELLAGGSTGFVAFRELIDRQVLPVAAGYRCGHTGCPDGGRCAVLGRLVDEVPLVVADVERAVAVAGQQASADALSGYGWPTMSQGERDRATGLAAGLTLQPQQRETILRTLAGSSRQNWWRPVMAAARSAVVATIAGRAALVTAAVLLERRMAADGQVRQTVAERRATLQRAWLLRAGGAALTAVALLCAAGTGAWIKALRVSGLGSSFEVLTASGGTLGEAMAGQQYRLLPALVLLAVITVGLSRGRSGVFVAAVGTAAVLGYLAVELPDFPVDGPAAMGDGLVWLGGRWTGKAVVALPLVYAAAAVAMGRWARSVTATSERLLPRYGLPVPTRRATGRSRLVAAPLVLVALLATSWVAVVARATMAGWSTSGADIGAAAGYFQSAYAYLLATVAVLVCLPRPPGGRTLLGWALVVVTARVLWWKPIDWLDLVEKPVAPDLLSRLGAAPGDNVVWLALLLGVPIAALATSGAMRMLRRN